MIKDLFSRKNFLSFFIVLQSLDMLSTYFAIEHFNAKELNPLQNFVLTNFGWYGFISVGILGITIMMMLLFTQKQKVWSKTRYPLWAMNILYIFIPINNLILLR